MKIIFFDTETTGLAKSDSASYTDIDNWPRLVQIAWIVCDEKQKIISKGDYIVKPCGYVIPKSSSKVHGITHDNALVHGILIEDVLSKFLKAIKNVDAIVGHNIDFDINVIKCEMYRLSLPTYYLNNPIKIDTMITGTEVCKIRNNRYGYRYPKLSELYSKLFSKTFENAHNAYADIDATFKIFWELVNRGYINKEEYPFLLTKEEKISIAANYNKQAIEIIWGTRRGSREEAEKLYIKSAKLGNTESMYKIALFNMGGRFVALRTDYDTAIKWLKEIIRLYESGQDTYNGHYYKDALKSLVSIYQKINDYTNLRKYQVLLDDETDRQMKEIIANAYKTKENLYNLYLCYSEGNNGFTKDKAKAESILLEAIEKGYRNFYWTYTQHLINKKDPQYFYYLLEDIKDTELALEEEYKLLSYSHNTKTAEYMRRTHKDFWLTKKYRLVAEGYLTGFGVEYNVDKGIEYIQKALRCDSTDYKTSFLLARVMNGEFGNTNINFDRSIRQLESLPINYMDEKIVWAHLGDSYFGKGLSYFFKAKSCYNKYPDIETYKSPLRSKYKKVCLIINLSALISFVLFIIALFCIH